MNKLVELIYWIRIFLSPFLVAAFLAACFYMYNERFLWLAFLLLVTGALVGGILAERVRRKYGTTNYVAKIHETPDIMPYDEIVEPKSTKDKGGA